MMRAVAAILIFGVAVPITAWLVALALDHFAILQLKWDTEGPTAWGGQTLLRVFYAAYFGYFAYAQRAKGNVSLAVASAVVAVVALCPVVARSWQRWKRGRSSGGGDAGELKPLL
jgi:hypothetical protein